MSDVLRKQLEKAPFLTQVTAKDKEGILRELTAFLVAHQVVAEGQQEAVFAALAERERKMSTGMQFGVAIPHAKLPDLEELVVAVAVSPKGVEFDALDQKKTHIFVVTLSPVTEVGTHVRFLADISRLLSSVKVRTALIAAKSHEEMMAALYGQ